jgi:peptidoglycan/xylan/chitin deacetylase (PgdA/CDA1 family)
MKQRIAPFHIFLGPRVAGGAYHVRAVFDGDEVRADLQLPDFMLDFAARLVRSAAPAPLGDPALIGRTLGRALFTPPVRELLVGAAKHAARSGRRLQLQLQIAAPELAALPWELVTVGLSKPWSPALRDDYGLVRLSRSVRPVPPASVAGPLCVLAVAAPGEDLQLDTLEIALGTARAGRVQLRVLRDATPAALERALLDGPVHVLHLAAPVVLGERGSPRLQLRRSVEALDLVDMLAQAAQLRLVTLAGAQGDGGTVGGGLPALATVLLAADRPATIVFGGPVPARLAARFALACYARLAAGAPVDQAVTTGRRALAESGGRGWGLAQLRLVPGGERLFTFRRESRRMPARLPRSLLVAGASIALAGAVLLGARAVGTRAPASTSPQALPTAGLLASTPSALVATPTQQTGGLLLSLLGGAATPEPTPTPVGIPEPTGYATYLTRADDTLEGIAQLMGSEAGVIATLNRLDPRAPLRAERPLVIPVYREGAAGAGGLVINRGNPAERKVALTFDIEIDDRTLYAILDILRARGYHGTFFVTGHWVMAYPDAARAIVHDGHEIANHSLSHPYFSRIGPEGAAAELAETERLVKETTGVTSRPMFRFPYGDYTLNVANVVARDGYVAYHWSADDDAITGWLERAAQSPADANGGILLMHGRASTVAALPGWLDRLVALGLQPTTLGDTLK